MHFIRVTTRQSLAPADIRKHGRRARVCCSSTKPNGSRFLGLLGRQNPVRRFVWGAAVPLPSCGAPSRRQHHGRPVLATLRMQQHPPLNVDRELSQHFLSQRVLDFTHSLSATCWPSLRSLSTGFYTREVQSNPAQGRCVASNPVQGRGVASSAWMQHSAPDYASHV